MKRNRSAKPVPKPKKKETKKPASESEDEWSDFEDNKEESEKYVLYQVLNVDKFATQEQIVSSPATVV